MPVYPIEHSLTADRPRALTLISTTLSTDSWEQVEFLSKDIVVTLVKGEWGKLYVFNIYNNCDSNDTIKMLKTFHRES
jgi:hypothetical protein